MHGQSSNARVPETARVTAALGYIKRGWRPVPIPLNSKAPTVDQWQQLAITASDANRHFAGTGNIGVILGVDGLTDIDLDCPEAVTAGGYLLPPTGMIFGRTGKPRSHYVYLVTPAAPMEKLLDPTDKKVTICEYRCQRKDGGIGLQTVFPPSIHPSGEAIEFVSSGQPSAIAESEIWIAFYRTASAALLARHWPSAGEGRHDTMLALAGCLARAGWPENETLVFCRAVYRSVPTHDPTAVSRVDGEVADTYKSMAVGREFTGFPTLREHLKNAPKVIAAISKWLRLDADFRTEGSTAQKSENDEAPPVEELPADALAEQQGDHTGIEMSELGLSACLVTRYSRDLRHASEQRVWLIWTGTHWQKDTTQEVMRRMIGIVRQQKIQNCKSLAKMTGAIKLASADRQIAAALETFDRNNYLLNFLNGTLNLRTGELVRHRREDLITKLIPFNYSPSARAPRWERFLQEVFAAHPELVHWIQRAIGYSLTGDVREHCFFLMLGDGRNGKGLFINTLKLILGPYAHQADFRAFEPKYGDGPSDAIANFKAARLLVASESREGARFDEPLMKTLTGGDPIRARLLYENSFEMEPTWKIWLATNHRPQIRGTDPAMWQRVRLIPFEISFAGREDRSLSETLLREAEGIIAWAVEGTARWFEEGLEPLPEAVKMATEAYRTDSDIVGRFVEEECQRGVQFSSPARILYRAYASWAEESGEKHLTETAFGLQLTQRGFEKSRNSTGTVYHGLILRKV